MKKNQTAWLLLPLAGIVIFVALYCIASRLYPGGSSFDVHSKGFSWTKNYWCNLLGKNAINGEANPAHYIAIPAMFVLAATLVSFWWIFPPFTILKRYYQWMIRISGTLAAVCGLFLFTDIDHDLVTNMASIFGLVAGAGTLAGLYKNKWKLLFYAGIGNIALVILNNILYRDETLIRYLPLVQKITFAAFLAWIACINIKVFRVCRKNHESVQEQ